MKKHIIILTFILPIRLFGQWEFVNEGIRNNSFTMDFINNDTGWIAGKDFVYKTTDKGEHWDSLPGDKNDFLFLKIDFINDTVGWAINSNSIIKTQDGGQTWIKQKKSDGLNTFYALNKDIVYLAGYDNVFYTKDGGANWENVLYVKRSLFYSICFINADTGLVTGYVLDSISWGCKGYIAKTYDGGKTWIKKTIPEFVRIFDTKIINDSALYFLAIDEDSGNYHICKTNDLFDTWSVLASSPFRIFSCHFFSDDVAMAVMVDSIEYNIMKSIDGGHTWESVRNLASISLFGGGTCDIIYGINDVVYIHNSLLSSNILMKSIDQGNNWSDIILTYPINDVSFINCEEGFFIGGEFVLHGSYGNVFKTNNRGRTWESILDTYCPLTSCVFTNDLNGFINTDCGLLQTSDGGENWTWHQDFYVQGELFFINDKIGWALRYNDQDSTDIIQTRNGGISWSLNSSIKGDLDNVYFTGENTGWAVGDEGIIIKYKGGFTWENQKSGTSLPLNKVYFVNSNAGWITGGYNYYKDLNPILLKTIDGGENWSEISELNYLINDMYFIDSQNGWAVGEDEDFRGVILKTTDSGNTWTVEMNTIAPLTSMHCKDKYLWVTGENGLILRLQITNFWINELTMDNASYVRPEKDTVNVRAVISNPEDYDLLVTLIIKSLDGIIRDSIIMMDLGDAIWKGSWPVIAGERFYSIELNIVDSDTSNANYTYSSNYRFTTTGPLVIHEVSLSGEDTLPDPGDSLLLSIVIKNEGSVTTISDIKGKLVALDSLGITENDWQDLYEILPGDTNKSYWPLNISENCQYGTKIPIQIEMSSNDYTYWIDTFYFLINNPLKIPDMNISVFKLYPNPARDIVNIQLPGSGNGIINIEIYDITGKMIYNKQCKNRNSNFNETVNVSDLLAGIYFIKIRHKNNVSFKKFIIK